MTLRCLSRKVMQNNVGARFYYSKRKRNFTSAGIVVIGDEILKGAVADTNSTFLAKELHRLGLRLKKISVIADDVKQISVEVRDFSNQFDYVLTTGGIGPTHDDVTYEAVAHAFNEPLILHPELKEICSKFYQTSDPCGAGMKLAFVPKSSKLHYLTTSGDKLTYPNVSIRNVYMFPGVPELLKRTILKAGPLLFKSNQKFFTKVVYCSLPEHKILGEMEQLAKEFPDVELGCYPKFFDSEYKVKVTIESSSEESAKQAYLRLLQLIPAYSVVNKLEDN